MPNVMAAGRSVRGRHAGWPRSQGQALVEFALIAPILVLMIVSIFDIGSGVFAYNSVTNAAREGARLAIVNQDSASVSQRAISQTAVAETEVPNVTVTFRRATPNANPTQNAICARPVAVGCMAIVTFQTTYRPFTPIVAQILFPAGVTLTATSVLPVEFTCPNSTTTAPSCPRQP